MSTLIQSSSSGRITAPKKTMTRAFMANVWSAAPIPSARTAETSPKSPTTTTIDDILPVRFRLLDMRALSGYVRYQQWGNYLTKNEIPTPRNSNGKGGEATLDMELRAVLGENAKIDALESGN